MKLVLLKNRDMIVNKLRLNSFLCEAKLHYFKYYIEPNLKRKQIDLWERNQIITNIKRYVNLLKQLYYNKDDMSVEEYLKEIGWDGYIDIFENDYNERGFRKYLQRRNMTNKLKYIDKVSAKAAAETLGNVLWYYYAKGKRGNFKDVLYDWLSQETEEDNDFLSAREEIEEKIKGTKKGDDDDDDNDEFRLTNKIYHNIVKNLSELKEICYHHELAIERLENVNQNDDNKQDKESEKTADEMFEELGYVITYKNGILYVYDKKDDKGYIERISIYCTKNSSIYKKEVGSGDEFVVGSYISKAEDKAIYKKIEELKNE
ncbi:MAG: hypothetical protein IJ593_03015 [Lachnospiraceae bacterium]|nr:hypothetical protein [Lachnospiraceae bacterium]